MFAAFNARPSPAVFNSPGPYKCVPFSSFSSRFLLPIHNQLSISTAPSTPTTTPLSPSTLLSRMPPTNNNPTSSNTNPTQPTPTPTSSSTSSAAPTGSSSTYKMQCVTMISTILALAFGVANASPYCDATGLGGSCAKKSDDGNLQVCEDLTALGGSEVKSVKTFSGFDCWTYADSGCTGLATRYLPGTYNNPKTFKTWRCYTGSGKDAKASA
ncbi:hypothetical protein PG997_002586 [Apiospora hydei]|uniref:Uncharacterized protein n=1 Tax=Apiospora hydei TaxID=1337664 RepID=A0ABR1WWS8_9PEZI